jgi:N-acetylglucosamine malate deacetylase 2
MKVLAIGAHPDDEIYAAGYLAKRAAEGDDVYILLTTRGEGGPLGDPPLCEREGLPALRVEEGRASGRAIGARDVLFLPFVDPLPGPNRGWRQVEASLEEFSGAIAEVLRSLQPDVVVTHGSTGEYGHPQHKYTHAAVFAALEQVAPWRPSEVLTWEAAFEGAEQDRAINPGEPADIVLDVTPWLPQKIAALKAHTSQYPAFLGTSPGRTLEECADRIESFHRWEPGHTA